MNQMKAEQLKQRAEIRVVLHDNGRYHLVLDARVHGFDVYSQSGLAWGKKANFKSSWHETGKTHLFTPFERQIGTQKVAPQNFKGKMQLPAGAHGGVLTWGYKLKADTNNRRSLVIEVSLLEGKPYTAELWAVEQGREDLVQEIVTGAGYQGKEVVGYIVADWTQPQLVALVSTLTDSAMSALNQSIGH